MEDENLQGTGTEEAQSAPETQETGDSEATQTQGAQDAQQKEVFLDPSDMPEELKPHWKKMQGTFTKRMQEFAENKNKVEAYDRFYNDPEFRRQTVIQMAQEMGLTLGQAQQQAEANQAGGTQVPQGLIDAVAAELSPEMQWMAPQLAKAQWKAMEMVNKPREEREALDRRQQAENQYSELAEQLDGKYPGWQEREDDMADFLDFMRSPKMTDKKFGSKLEIMYRAVVGDSLAISEAAKRMNQAGQNRSSISSSAGRSSAPNVTDRILKSNNNQEAWKLAAQAATEELKKAGLNAE